MTKIKFYFLLFTFILLVDGPCNPDPCKNFGTCQVLSLNSYYCACPTGWTGDNCDEGKDLMHFFFFIVECLNNATQPRALNFDRAGSVQQY